MSQDFHERLAWSRRRAGFTGSRDAARAFGWNENTYKSHETGVRAGTRPPEQEVVRKYARAFDVDFIWLLTGEGAAQKRNLVRVVGRIGAGAEIHPDFEQAPSDGLYEIEAPFAIPDEAIAFEIEGESMQPRYDPGDVVICWREGANAEDLLGLEAAVRTEDGRRFLKRILRGSRRGLFDLESHNSALIRDVRIVWISGISAVVRAGQWRKLDAPAARAATARFRPKLA